MIDADSLTARFDNRTVVNAISFKLQPTGVVGFLGPNGAGKSTTMRMLCGFLVPFSGTATIRGYDIVRSRRTAQSLIGYLPEAARGFDDLTVAEFLNFCGQARGLRKTSLRNSLARICEQIELKNALGTRIGELSKGWRQRVWFAQALLHDPPVLILDEPTDGLDPNQKIRVRSLIRELSSTKTILLSTHILEEAEELCSRSIIINDGNVVADTETAELMDNSGRLAGKFHQLTNPPQVHSRCD